MDTDLIYILAIVNMKNYTFACDHEYYSQKTKLIKETPELMLYIDRHLRAQKNVFYECMLTSPNNNSFLSVFILIRMY